MSKKNKRILWCLYVAIFVLPLLSYFVVNGYLWLFGSNQPNESKMEAAVGVGLLAWTLAVHLADSEKIWKKDER